MTTERKTRSDKGARLSEWVERPCATCGKTVERRASEVREFVYCSRQCFARNPGYDGGGRPVTAQLGTRKAGPDGYMLVYVGRSEACRSGWSLEHRKVMEDTLGRRLRREETVHHRNAIRDDNRPANLELWASRQPKGSRVVDLVAFALEILVDYEAWVPTV